MNKADEYYIKNLNKIKEEGCWDENPRPKYKDGVEAYSKFITQVFEEYDISKGEFPIPTLRNTAIKTGIKEILAIYQKQTNTRNGFESSDVFWWEPWMNEQGNIGKAYSYNLESHRDNDINKEIKKIKKIKINESFSKVKEFVKINEIEKSLNNIIYFDRYIIIGNSNKTDKQKRFFYEIQFINSGYKTYMRKDLVGISHGKDIYDKNNFNIGYLGNYSTVKNFNDTEIKILMDKWENMLRRCYSNNYEFKELYKNIFVHQDWHSFESFLMDIRLIPQFHLAREDNFKNWELDKDYFGSNCYSKETCVFLKKKDNILYSKSYPIIVKNSDGVETIIINLNDFCDKNQLSQSLAYRVLNGERNHTKGYSFNKLEYDNDNYVYRYEISRNQVNSLLKNLEKDKYSRRHIISFWNWANIDKKELVECAYETMWLVRKINDEYYLDMTLIQRSNDYITAGYINKIQYVALQMMVAGHLNYKVGKFCHFTQNVHIYDRHIDALEEVLGRTSLGIQPKLILKENKDFYNYTIDDFEIVGIEDIQKINSPLELAI